MAYVYPILIKSFITNLVNMVPEPFELVEDDGDGGGGVAGSGAAGVGAAGVGAAGVGAAGVGVVGGGGSWVGWPSIKIIYIIII
jgi:hypothetical protein